jgi:sec-independent protein translocase protein TatA
MFEGLLQPMHLLVVVGIALLVFGPKKLPELGKGLGDGIRGFRSAMKEIPESTDTELPKPEVYARGVLLASGSRCRVSSGLKSSQQEGTR